MLTIKALFPKGALRKIKAQMPLPDDYLATHSPRMDQRKIPGVVSTLFQMAMRHGDEIKALKDRITRMEKRIDTIEKRTIYSHDD